MGAGGEAPENVLDHAFLSKGDALFYINRVQQKGLFRSFAENGRDPDPQDPLVARMRGFKKKLKTKSRKMLLKY